MEANIIFATLHIFVSKFIVCKVLNLAVKRGLNESNKGKTCLHRNMPSWMHTRTDFFVVQFAKVNSPKTVKQLLQKKKQILYNGKLYYLFDHFMLIRSWNRCKL